MRGTLGVRGSFRPEQVPHGLVGGHVLRMLRLSRQGDLPVTTKAHNAKVNGERGEMNLVKLIEDFADESKCRKYLEDLRWPNGVRCPRCGSDKVKRIVSVNSRAKVDPRTGERPKRHQFDCSCGYQFSVRVGTVFHDSHLPLWKWFLATYLMCESKKGMSANQLKRTLGVTYETAWYLCHRIRSAMDEATVEALAGIVEIDETYVGGKSHRYGSKDKVMVMGALQRDGDVRLRVETQHRTRGKEIKEFVEDMTYPGTTEMVYTDGHNAYKSMDVPHESVDHGEEEWVRGDVSTNGIESAWSLLKRSIVGSYHQLSAKHLQAYADEFAFRFNNRENPFLFRDTLLRLIDADALPYAELVGSAH
jgi:transposase-like protein